MNGEGEGGVAVIRTTADIARTKAHSAWEHGQAELRKGRLDLARAWLERARRLAPGDATVQLSLATVLLSQGDPGAAALFAALAARLDRREVWVGMIAACRASGDTAGAAVALTALLSRHATGTTAEFRLAADAVARSAGAPGWCGMDTNGAAVIAPGGIFGGRPVAVHLDGTPWLADDSRPVPPGAARLTATIDGVALLGSPVAVDVIRRIEGAVEASGGGIEGWAWHPGDPSRDPRLTLVGLDGSGSLTLVASDASIDAGEPLARPRRFALARQDAARFRGPVRVEGPDGQELTGSPVDPGAPARAAAAAALLVADAYPVFGTTPTQGEATSFTASGADIMGPPAAAPAEPMRGLVVVVPVYRGLASTLACLASVRATSPFDTPVVMVDDASPEPDLSAALDDMAERGQIHLVRHPVNRGFPTAANAGLRAAASLPGGRDIVLLNSDTVPGAGWLQALRAVVHSAPDIGTATPFSNDATILTYPDPRQPGPPPDDAALRALARLAGRAGVESAVEIPTGVGFCLYVRRECLIQTGVFRDDVFAQGYGEENDFCIRARHLGWRHVAVPSAYVAHVGAQSFGAARRDLVRRNTALLERLHPGYAALIAAWQARDPLLPARRRLDGERWAAARKRTRSGPKSAILITHDSGGGVERAVRDSCARLRDAGLRPIVIRPVLDREAIITPSSAQYLPGTCRLDVPGEAAYPNLRFQLPTELPELVALLGRDRPSHVEIHHLLGHHPCLSELAGELGIPYDAHVHDFGSFCPRLSLLGPDRRYCGEPDLAACETCIADAGSNLEDGASVAELRARSARQLAAARRVVVPSADAGARLRRHFRGVMPVVEPHEVDAAADAVASFRPFQRPGEVRRICVIGAISIEKGYEILLGCARHAAMSKLDLEFTVVGHTIDDERLLATGRVFITGPYAADEAVSLIRAQEADLAFLPSLIPETWCYTLGEAWRGGLHVVAFDIGAPAERIRKTGRGHILPLGLSPAAVNKALMSVRAVAGAA